MSPQQDSQGLLMAGSCSLACSWDSAQDTRGQTSLHFPGAVDCPTLGWMARPRLEKALLSPQLGQGELQASSTGRTKEHGENHVTSD